MPVEPDALNVPVVNFMATFPALLFHIWKSYQLCQMHHLCKTTRVMFSDATGHGLKQNNICELEEQLQNHVQLQFLKDIWK